MLYIYTENFFFLSRLKNIIKRFLGKLTRGPQTVADSLTAGLKELDVSFLVNKKSVEFIEAACVLSGIQTLKWAIKQKQQGKIGKIIAGPNLVIMPNESRGILKNDLLDVVVVPSEWVKDYYSKIDPKLENKIKIWPAGVNIPSKKNHQKTIDFLIYNKIGKSSLFYDLANFLQEKKYHIQVVEYGKFHQQKYFELLSKSKNLIYLSESESQGLAMFEAWASGVPVLVWERGFWQIDKYNWQGITASPYTAPENGMRFKDFEDFKKVLPKFLSSSFFPHEFIEKNFTNKICAKKYLEIVNNA